MQLAVSEAVTEVALGAVGSEVIVVVVVAVMAEEGCKVVNNKYNAKERECNLSTNMSTRPPRSNPPLTLALPPPSHTHPPAISTPTHAYQSDATISHSPRRAPLPPSPTYSTHPASQTIWLEDRNRGHSLDVSQADRDLPPLPGKSEKRLPLPPNSPHQAVRGVYAGAYDNKLVDLSPASQPLKLTTSGVVHPVASPSYTSSFAHFNRGFLLSP